MVFRYFNRMWNFRRSMVRPNFFGACHPFRLHPSTKSRWGPYQLPQNSAMIASDALESLEYDHMLQKHAKALKEKGHVGDRQDRFSGWRIGLNRFISVWSPKSVRWFFWGSRSDCRQPPQVTGNLRIFESWGERGLSHVILHITQQADGSRFGVCNDSSSVVVAEDDGGGDDEAHDAYSIS